MTQLHEAPNPPNQVGRNTILTGDALDQLRTIPDASVDQVVTSPPYFRLRDYGSAGQLGLEAHVDTWADQLRAVLRECHRVLVPTGSLWLNLGDSYSTHPREGAARKSLLLAPERLAQLLIEDGWILRNKIVWAKPNTIPTSVRDRLATKHETIYLLTKSPAYYFDLDSLREPHTSKPPRPRQPSRPSAEPGRESTRPPNRPAGRPAWLGPSSDDDEGLRKLHAAGIRGHPLGKNPGDVWNIAVSRFRGAHFATYPEALARRMILAGSPRMRCSVCRKPWTRRLIRQGQDAHRQPPRSTCTCAAGAEPGLVLDPFIGSGTTAIAAAKLGRDWLGIELNPDFVAMAHQRISDALHPTTTATKRKEVT